jgi:hypothetical protein
MGSHSAIREGNDIAHSGDVITDICLFKNDLIKYDQTFATLYSLDWREAMDLIGTLIDLLWASLAYYYF